MSVLSDTVLVRERALAVARTSKEEFGFRTVLNVNSAGVNGGVNRAVRQILVTIDCKDLKRPFLQSVDFDRWRPRPFLGNGWVVAKH